MDYRFVEERRFNNKISFIICGFEQILLELSNQGVRDMRNAYKVLVGKHLGTIPLGRSRYK